MTLLSKAQNGTQTRVRGRTVGRRAAADDHTHLRAFKLGDAAPPLAKMMEEVLDMMDVLMGRKAPPIEQGIITLMEVADAYFARSSEMTMIIQRAEREGSVLKGSAAYLFRTGELRTFMEVAKRASDLGSRRITYAQMKGEAERYGRESREGRF